MRREYEIPLEDGSTLAIHYDFERGEIVRFAVVLLAEIDGAPACVARYDDAHGIPHLDLLDRSGRLREKVWLP